MTTQPKQYKLLKDLPLTVGNIYFKKNNVWCENRDEPVKKDLAAILDTVENNPEWLEPIPETPKPVMKYDNGAIVESLKDGQIYYSIMWSHHTSQFTWSGQPNDEHNLFHHNIFLTQQEAEKALLQQQTYNRLYKKIREIDEQNDFICDWSDTNQEKWYVDFFTDNNLLRVDYILTVKTQGTTYMSEQSANYLCSDAVSKADQKLFCGILD